MLRSSSSRITAAFASSRATGSPLDNNCTSPAAELNATLILNGSTSTPEYPVAQRIRPQLASLPYIAVLNSEELAMEFATCLASCSLAKASISAWKASKFLWSSVMVSPPAAPLAMAAIVSLVDMSVSTAIQLNERSTVYLSILFKADGVIGASVTKKPSNVAILGQIIPAPLDRPAIEYLTPSNSKLFDTSLGNVSVVMIPFAHSSQ
ncbi:hypothetical protein OGAPHI_001605 [Ogataea philodendri]|uniref:Uncharacterized protein n=1 Tax=Ogataea philodendri TaxID=1378263 RepID=A0A9P8T8F9_9ASCO|nr:uncharacterized protein OGAPHI_001605 [Ogataea philodendri]KAH3669484.1 hypothetical protein OGAPHI_001605 [Ogataea philodendri]